MDITKCMNGFRYRVVQEDGSAEDKCLSDLMCTDDVCLLSNSADQLQEIPTGIESCREEYGLKVSERKSKVVCVNGESQSREWKCGMIKIQEVRQYTYLGVTVQGGVTRDFRSMGDRMKEANGVIGMIKYVANRSGNKYVIDREGYSGE